MKVVLSFLWLLNTQVCIAQADKNIIIEKVIQLVENNQIYLVCRGTRSKSSLIAEKFNLIDTNITHVGLGMKINNNLFIYHIEDNKTQNAFSKQLIADYIKAKDVYYLSIYSFEMSLQNRKRITRRLRQCDKRNYHFDDNILLNNGNNNLYCSEFVAHLLNDQLPPSENFFPIERALNNDLYEAVLQRQKLLYFPVDIFIHHKYAQHVYSARFLEEVF